MSTDWYDQQFDLQRKSPDFWWLSARRLKRAAELVWVAYDKQRALFSADPDRFFEEERKSGAINTDFELSETYFFLMALAIEGIVKGVLVTQDIGNSDRVTKSHDLPKWVSEAGIEVDEEESFLLGQLTILIEWQGRYPTPKKLDDWKLKKDTKGHNVLPGRIAPDDKGKVEALYDKFIHPTSQDHT